MIKIEIAESAIQKHLDTWIDSVGTGLDFFILGRTLNGLRIDKFREKMALIYLKHYAKFLLIGRPSKLAEIQQKVAKIIKRPLSDNFMTVLNKIFDYDTFQEGKFIDWAQIVDGATQRKKRANDWGASEFIEALDLRVCPYCNRSYIFSVKKKTKQIKADLDHFFDKATYPYLAISLYNLIPCCQACNSRAKGMATMSLEKHCHPYVDNFHELVKFSIKMENVRDFYKCAKELELKLIKCGDELASIKAEKTAKEVFHLEKTYEGHRDYADEIKQKCLVYNKDFLDSLKTQFEELGISEADFDRYIFGNYTNPEEINKRPLSKLTIDLMEQFRGF